jgi:BirA family biotin operon repressor/biotin-[acetyl-CoA-carboxylase] ligase
MDLLNANQSGKWHVAFVEETGSTNADLLAQGAQGAPDRTVLRANYQSAGRGRLDRTWEAPRGVNLLVSMLFRHIPERLHVLTQVVALAAAAVARDCGVPVTLKWPNDILVGTEKVAGILAQAAPAGPNHRIPFVVVGIGCNLAWAPPGAASLASSGWLREVSPDEFLALMLPEIDRLLALDDAQMHAEYVSRLGTIGAQVKVDLPNGEHVIGRAMDVEPDGRLVVLDECAITHRIDTADVVHLRPVTE